MCAVAIGSRDFQIPSVSLFIPPLCLCVSLRVFKNRVGDLHSLGCSHVLSCNQHFVNLWIVAHQAPLFSRQEYWSRFSFPSPGPFPSLGDLPNPGIKHVSPVSPALQADSLPLSHWGSPLSAVIWGYIMLELCWCDHKRWGRGSFL